MSIGKLHERLSAPHGVQQTILEECWKPAFARSLVPKQTGLKLDLERDLRYYNTQRAHTGRWTRAALPKPYSGRPSCGTRSADASPQPGDRTSGSLQDLMHDVQDGKRQPADRRGSQWLSRRPAELHACHRVIIQ
jgi:hypothetical protein